MNLVLSGMTAAKAAAEIERLARPTRVVPFNSHALRLENCLHSPATRHGIALLAEQWRVDHAYVEATSSITRTKLLAMDMDSTLITIECIDELAELAGKRTEVAAITEATMRGEIVDFGESLSLRVALLAGLRADLLEAVYRERVQLSPGATDLIAVACSYGAKVLLVSGGFTYFTDRLREELCLDAAYANTLEIVGGRLTGRIVGPVVDATAKARFVRRAMEALACTPDEAIIIGDGANDIPMMTEAVHSVAYRAKPRVVAAARYSVKFGTLQTVLDFLH